MARTREEEAQDIQTAMDLVRTWYHSVECEKEPTPPRITMAIGVLAGAAARWREHVLRQRDADG